MLYDDGLLDDELLDEEQNVDELYEDEYYDAECEVCFPTSIMTSTMCGTSW